MQAAIGDPRDHLIERIYSAAGGVKPWDDALAQLSSYCGAQASYIDILSERERSISLVGAFGHASPLIERYHTYGHLIDPTTSQILANEGQPISFSNLSSRDLGGPAFHKEFIAPRGTDQVLAIGLRSEIGTLLVKLSRNLSGIPFTNDSAERLSSMSHHLRQAVIIDRSLRRRVETESFAATIVNRLRAAVVRLDERMNVLFANQAAYRLAADNDVIAIVQGRLRFVGSGSSETLRAFLRKASASEREGCETALLGSNQGRRVRVWGWAAKPEGIGGIQVGLVMLPDDYDAEVLDIMLRENYGLTPSEIRTAVSLLSNTGLSAVAEDTGVSLETVRFHMKRIFSKTGTCRQSEFVRVIANDLCCVDVPRSARVRP
jgi:DNA-binding CsgD family transcriptional regulator/PAS domain-containing protein